MLPRLLEPEVMDSPEEARNYNAMDHSAVNRVFVQDFLALWDGGNPVLDVGTGTALIPIELCRQSSTAQVVGTDLAEHMLRVGHENVLRAGLQDRIRLDKGDAKHLAYPTGSFAAVISNSIVHHIPEPGRVLAEMVRVARPGAELFVRDLLRPADAVQMDNLVSLYAGDGNSHQQQMFRASLHAALTLAEIRALVTAVGYEPATVQHTTDRHWTWSARKK